MRGYDKKEVDEFLDDVIKDYGVYIALVKELQEENAKLKAKASSAPASRPAYASATGEPSRANANVTSASNYDILKRISRLEKRGLLENKSSNKTGLCNFWIIAWLLVFHEESPC